MDIASALAASGPTERVGKCLLQKRLDSIDDEIEGKADLLAVIDTPEWSAPSVSKVFVRLGIPVSPTIIKDHRAENCACYR